MAWIWGGLAAIEPAFRTVTDSSDPGIRVADEGPGLARGPGHRRGRRLVVPGPAEARGAGRRRRSCCGRPSGTCRRGGASTSRSTCWARSSRSSRRAARLPLVTAALLAVSLMTKPQALPFLVPFGAWFLATQGWRGTLEGRGRRRRRGRAPVAAVRRRRRTGQLPRQPRHVPERHLRGPVAPGVEPVGAAPGARAPTASSSRTDSRVRAGHVPGRRASCSRALFALIVFVAVYRRPTADQLALGIAAHVARRVRGAHDDARALCVPRARVPAVRARPARGRGRLGRLRDHVPPQPAGRGATGGLVDPRGPDAEHRRGRSP